MVSTALGSHGIVARMRGWTYVDRADFDRGYQPEYAVVWDDYAHQVNPDSTAVPQNVIEHEPAVDQLARLTRAR